LAFGLLTRDHQPGLITKINNLRFNRATVFACVRYSLTKTT
jgi:hypothetical protein